MLKQSSCLQVKIKATYLFTCWTPRLKPRNSYFSFCNPRRCTASSILWFWWSDDTENGTTISSVVLSFNGKNWRGEKTSSLTGSVDVAVTFSFILLVTTNSCMFPAFGYVVLNDAVGVSKVVSEFILFFKCNRLLCFWLHFLQAELRCSHCRQLKQSPVVLINGFLSCKKKVLSISLCQVFWFWLQKSDLVGIEGDRCERSYVPLVRFILTIAADLCVAVSWKCVFCFMTYLTTRNGGLLLVIKFPNFHARNYTKRIIHGLSKTAEG